MVRGFRTPNTLPCCGKACWEITRRDGATLREALAAGSAAKFSLLEGWTDIYESAGYYRSSSWTFPNQYLDIVREYADPTPEKLRFQAEGADTFSNQSATADTTRIYRQDEAGIGKLADGTGWYVDWSQAGGWFEYAQVTLGCGTYRFTGRLSASSAQTVHLEVDGATAGAVSVPASGGFSKYELVHLATLQIPPGKHQVRLVSDSGGVNADWLFLAPFRDLQLRSNPKVRKCSRAYARNDSDSRIETKLILIENRPLSGTCRSCYGLQPSVGCWRMLCPRSLKVATLQPPRSYSVMALPR